MKRHGPVETVNLKIPGTLGGALALFFLLGGLFGAGTKAQAAESVVLLHGIARSSASMEKIEHALTDAGYRVLNVDYPSTDLSLAEIVEKIQPQISKFNQNRDRPLHVVTYSMGGLVARGLIRKHRPQNLGRVVMLSPPNRGSEMADFLKDNFLFKKFYGPAGQELGTDQQELQSILGGVDFELGVIAGDRSIDPLGSYLIPGTDDGSHRADPASREKIDSIVFQITCPSSAPSWKACKTTSCCTRPTPSS